MNPEDCFDFHVRQIKRRLDEKIIDIVGISPHAYTSPCPTTQNLPSVEEILAITRGMREEREKLHDAVLCSRQAWVQVQAEVPPAPAFAPPADRIMGLPVHVADTFAEALDVVLRMRREGKKLLIVGFDEETLQRAAKLLEDYPLLKVVAFHPEM